MKRVSYTHKTMELLRSQGWQVGVVERFMPPGIRVDLFGVIDLVAVHFDEPLTLGIQTTSYGARTAHLHKLHNDWPNPPKDEKEAEHRAYCAAGVKAWCASPHRELWLITWKKNKSNRWESRIEKISPRSP